MGDPVAEQQTAEGENLAIGEDLARPTLAERTGRSHAKTRSKKAAAAPASDSAGPPKPKKKTGRPSKLRTVNLVGLRKLAEEGLTTPEIAKALGLAVSSVNKYAATDKLFADALHAGRAVADAQIEKSLFERARGFEHDEERVTAMGEVATVKKRYPPDVLACIFWLKNRRPKEWRDKQEIEHSGEVDLIAGLSGCRQRAGALPEGGE